MMQVVNIEGSQVDQRICQKNENNIYIYNYRLNEF